MNGCARSDARSEFVVNDPNTSGECMKKINFPRRRMWFTVVACASFGLFAADENWLGLINTDWNEAGNWQKSIVPGTGTDALDTYYITVHSEGHNPLVVSDGMDLTLQMLRTTYSDGFAGEIEISGGSIRLKRDDVIAFTLGYSSFVPGEKLDWNICRISGGSLSGTSANAGMVIGRWSRGRLIQTGGDITIPGNILMSEQPGDTHEGEYLMSGGTLNQTGVVSVMRIGIKDDSAWMLSGDAEATLGSVLEIGYGDGVTLGGNARLTLSRICGAGDGRGDSKFKFDGGTLVLKSDVESEENFISDLAVLSVANGGAKIEVPSDARAVLRQPLTAEAGSIGGLVKKGSGTLLLATGNTYAGPTVVEAGILGIPGAIDIDTLTIAVGANVMIEPSKYATAELTKILAKVRAAGNESYLLMPMEIELGSGEVREISSDLDLGSTGLTLRGNGTLKLTGNNHWTGETRITGGTLVAKRGSGLPMGSKLVMAGGSWAPLDGSEIVPIAESETLEIADGSPLGIAAVSVPETVNLPVEPMLRLNENGDEVLTVANDLAVDSEMTLDVCGTAESAKTVLAGTISSSAAQVMTGRGALDIAGGWIHTAGDLALGAGELSVLDGATINSAPAVLLYSSEGTVVNIESGATLKGGNDIRIGDGNGQKGVLNLAEGGTLETSGYLHVARRGTATGTLNMAGGTVNAGSLIVGEGQSTGVLNQRGGSVTTGRLQMGNTRNEANGEGSATYNLESGRLEVTGNDPYIGYWGTAVFNLMGGEVVFPKRYAYIGTCGKTATFNQSGGKATFPSRLHLAYSDADNRPAKAIAEYNLSAGEMEVQGDLRVGNHGKGTFTMKGGSLKVDGYLHVGAETNEKRGNGSGIINFQGGVAEINSRTLLGTTTSARGEVNVDMVDDGTLTFAWDVDIGAKGTGVFNLKSGTVTQPSGYLYVSRETGSKGELNITGGVYDYQNANGVVTIGTRANGVLNISGGTLKTDSASRIELGYYNSDPGYVGSGTINLSGNGIIETARIHAGNGPASGILNVDGGTLRAVASVGDFLENIKLNLGENGLTLDSNGWDVSAAGAVISGTSVGAIRKVGAGTFAIHDFPMAKTALSVEAGTLRVVPQNLRHRWSFNGDYRDEVSGVEAMCNANVRLTLDGTALDMASDTRIDLGRNVLPVDHDATIEMWVTRKAKGVWEKLLTLGTGKNDVVCIGPQNNGTDEMVVVYTDTNTKGGSFSSGNTTGLGTLTLGEKRHLSITFERVSENETRVTYRQKDLSGTTLGAVTISPTGTLGTLAQSNCFLGQNPWGNPSTVCEIDEIRVWDVAMSDDELSASAKRGPDILSPATVSSVADDTVLVPDSLDERLVARNYLLHRWTFDGTLDDEVTGQAPSASAGTAYTADGKALRLAGGAKMENYVNLGSNLLPKDDSPLTIEIWATDNEFRNYAKVFSFGAGKTDLLSLNTNSGAEDRPGFLTFVSTEFGHGTENLNLSRNRFGERLYYGIVMVPNGEQLDVKFYVKNPSTGRTLESVERRVWWKPSLSAQNDFYLGVSYWNNEGPKMDYEEIRFWNAALSDAQLTANAIRGPDVLPTSFDTMPLKVEVAEGATLDFGNRPLTLHDLNAAGRLLQADLTVDGILTPGGEGIAGTLRVDGSLKITGTLRLDLGDTIQLTGDLDLSEAKVEIAATDDEILAYIRTCPNWLIAETTGGRIVTDGWSCQSRSLLWKNNGRQLKVTKRGFCIYFR